MRTLKLVILASIVFSVGAKAQDYKFKENRDPAVIAEAKANIISTGRACPSVSHVWNIVQNGQIQPVFQVSCSNDTDYQLTIVGGKLYVKNWTGNILGN